MRSVSVWVMIALLAGTAKIGLAEDYFVSLEGDDRHDGRTVDQSWRTLAHAASQLQPGDTCLIRGGVYHETVRPVRSGESDRPITFKPYRNERVQIRGCDPITGWESQGDGVWRAPMSARFFSSAINQSDQLFAGDQMLHEARWPDPTPHLSLPEKGRFTRAVSKQRDAKTNLTTGVFEDDQLPDWPDNALVGAGIYIQPNHGAWSWTFTGTVTANQGKTITFQSPNDCGKTGQQDIYDPSSRYFIFGHRALLNQPGEWWHDTNADVVYLRPPQGSDPDTLTIEGKSRDYAFDLTERSYIVIQGIELFACTITTDRNSGGDGIGYNADNSPRYSWRGKKSVAPSTHVVIDGVTVRYPSHFADLSGHFYLQWGQNTGIVLSGEDHIIRNCDIQFSAGNGITLLGRRHLALNNLIQDVNYLSTDCAAINTGGATVAEDIEIAFNTIRRCGRHGISYRKLTNSDRGHLRARIHHNDISHCMLQDWDGGGLYAAYDDHGFTRIDHNHVHDMTGYTVTGIYADFCKNLIIDHNLVWNVEWGILLQGQKDGVVNTRMHHNTLVVRNTSNSPYGPFGIAGGKGSKAGSDICNNIIVSTDNTRGYRPLSSDIARDAAQHSNLVADSIERVGFVTPDAADFRLDEHSPAIGAGEIAEAIPLDGTLVPAFTDTDADKPDLGALPYAADVERVGCDLPQTQPDAWTSTDYPAQPR